MSKIKFQALGTNVLVKAPVIEGKTKLGVYLPESAKETIKSTQTNFLEVVSIGEEVKGIKVGDKVLLKSGRHESITLNKVDYLIVYQGIIIGKELFSK